MIIILSVYCFILFVAMPSEFPFQKPTHSGRAAQIPVITASSVSVSQSNSRSGFPLLRGKGYLCVSEKLFQDVLEALAMGGTLAAMLV